MAEQLKLQVFTAGPEALSVTSTLVTGKRDAVLIDAQFARSEARRLAAQIQQTGKRLTTELIAAMTNAYPDLALPMILEMGAKAAFPAN